ncbi:MAG: iron chelate uptake ABC transporter family permease subunit, partial [Paludibacteraceae bacterium]|nr:iron chelate uptake ABC transporter family permease subunit [Paludibacteraceae bacterium]
MQRHSTILFVILSLLLVILFVLDLLIGSVHIPLRDILGALFGGDVDAATRLIVLDIRFIKAIVAVLAGIALSVSG